MQLTTDRDRVMEAPLALKLGIVLFGVAFVLGCPNSAGGLSMEELLERLDGRLDESVPEMAECFRRELGTEAARVDGRIVVRFEVAEDGLVNALEVVENELTSKDAELCVSDTIRRIYFAEWVGRKPVRLTKPFQFVAGR